MKPATRKHTRPAQLWYDTIGWRWGIVIGYTAVIFCLSSIPGSSIPSIYLNDKLIHAGEFGLLGIFLARALSLWKPAWSTRCIALWSILVSIAYGVTDEWHQSFVPQRSADFADLAADSVGALIAVWLWSRVGIRWMWLRY
ncbi:MAG: VanZ family protein [Candidatus Tectomicrobia bacterium]|uniref:VanZ family protein n=1 Tax=Tectimicrobiota bacterium TaxID=2528274 RepID=A0A937VWJ6_UNCTE|nr:VanZ family protein [Candidatus Tectomicrobia bacterium]